MADESDDAQVKNSADDDDDDDVEMNESESVGQESQIGSSFMPSSQYSHYKMRRGLANYIASSGELYTSAQHVRFEKFIKNYVQSEYSGVPLHTITSDSLNLFNDMKREMIAELSRFDGTISISTNFWSRADGQVGYVCVTAHYIDSAWLLQRRILGFRMLEYPRNDNVIFQCIMDIVREYMIDDKILSITFDDVTGTDAIIDMFKNTLQPTCGGQIFYVRCLGFVVNSVVQEGMKLMEVHLEKIRGAILYIASTSTRQEEFAALCESRGLKRRNLKPDFKTHWNSIFIMLNSCDDYSAAIRDYYNDKHEGDTLLSNNDWEMSNAFMTFLMVFCKAALMGSEVYAPTSSGVLFMLRYVSNCFAVNRIDMIPEFTAVYEAMRSTLESYCECMSPSFCLAAAMEPTLKQDGVDYYVNDISENISMPGLKTDAKAVEDRLHDLYKGYESKFAQKEISTSDLLAKTKRDSFHERKKEEKRQKDIKTYGGPTELHKYLGVDYTAYMTNEEFQDFDVLAWWKKWGGSFPVLSKMARDLLTLPVFAIAPEFVFSTTAGNQVLDYKRSMQPSAMLDSLFCMKDWEDARLRVQNWSDFDMIKYFADSDWSRTA